MPTKLDQQVDVNNFNEQTSKPIKATNKKRKLKDIILLSISVIVTISVTIFITGATRFHQIVKEGIPVRPFTDFYWIALAAVGFHCLKKLFNVIFFKPFYRRLQLKKLHDE